MPAGFGLSVTSLPLEVSGRMDVFTGSELDVPAFMSADMEAIRLWRDPVLGVAGTELLAGRFVEHRLCHSIRDDVAIAIITGGAMRYRIGESSGLALAGSVLVVPAGAIFYGEAATDIGWSCRVFFPDVRTITDMPSDVVDIGAMRLPETSAGPMHRDVALARRLAGLHRAIEEQNANPAARQQAFAAAVALVLQRCARPAGWPYAVRPENKAVRRAVERVHVRFADQRLTVADLAAAAGYSEYHFMRAFRAAVGVTAHDYVVLCRLHAARRMLASGVAAAEVALATGFADQSHLIRQFRAMFGVTPGSYAEQCRKRASARPGAAGVRPHGEIPD